jgi:CHAD domain-containing protein
LDVGGFGLRNSQGYEGSVERELKFEGNGVVEIERLGGVPLETRTFSSTYYDTPDRRLLRAGITLRRRVEHGLGVWQLSLPAANSRLELEDPGGPGSPPSSISDVLSGILRDRAVEPIATMRTHRRGRRVDGVAVTVDDVEIIDGHAVVDRFTEIEAELLDGPPAAVERVGRRLEKLGARSAAGLTKLAHAVESPAAEQLDRRASVLRRVQARLETQLEELLRNDPVVRMSDDDEAVHDMRVAVRRLRSLLRTARPLLDRSWAESLRAELDWLAGRLGAVRDLDVLIEHLEAAAGDLDGGDAALGPVLVRPLASEHDRARERLRSALEKARYYELLDTLESATEMLPARGDDVRLRKLVAKEVRKLRRRASGFPALNDAALHRMRIQGKRARYAAELAAPVEGKRARRFVDAARDLQDVLGEHQDAVVAIRQLRELARAAGRTDTALVAGRLIEREQERKHETRRDAVAAWKHARRAAKRVW